MDGPSFFKKYFNQILSLTKWKQKTLLNLRKTYNERRKEKERKENEGKETKLGLSKDFPHGDREWTNHGPLRHRR